MKVQFKSSDFFGVPFPVVIADRYFKIYENEIGLTVDVIRWDPERQDGVYEVQRGRNNAAEMSGNPTGLVSLDMKGGAFIFEFSPRPGVARINGKAPINENWTVRIDDHEVAVLRGGSVMQTLGRRAQASNAMIGIQVGADGVIETGVDSLPAGLEVERL